jgi:hypothetical protein
MHVKEIVESKVDEGWKQNATAAAIAAGMGIGGLAYKHYQNQQSDPSKYSTAQEVERLQKNYPEQEHARSEKFQAKLKQVANALQVNPQDLFKVIWFETKGTFDPSKTNAIGATGLIQFMPKTAQYLGTTTEALRKMSAVEQLDWVLKYYKVKKLPPGSKASDIYLSTFMPAVITHNKPDSFVLGAKNQYNIPLFKSISADKLNRGSVWDQNPVFRERPEIKKRGYFTVGDVRALFDGRMGPS